MKLTYVWGILLSAQISICFAEEPPTTSLVGELELNSQVFNQFQMMGTKTQPYPHWTGTQVTPDIKVNLSYEVKDNPQAISTQLNLNINGNTTSPRVHYSGPMAGIVQGHVDPGATVNGSYSQELWINQGGMVAGNARGGVNIVPYAISQNNFENVGRGRIGARINQKAQRTAAQTAAPIVQVDRSKLQEQIQNDLNNASAKAQEVFSNTFKKVSGFSNPEEFPLKSTFSSSSGPNGKVNVKWVDNSKKERAAPPTLTLPGQQAARAVVHEDFLNHLIGESLKDKDGKGKVIHLSELKDVGKKAKKFLNLFEEDFPKAAEDISIHFDSEDPIKFEFQDGKIKVKLNASYSYKGSNPIPYVVEAVYSVQGTQGKRESLKVTEKNGKTDVLGAISGSHGISDLGKRIASPFISSLAKTQLEEGFGKVFKKELNWPVISIPTKAKMNLDTPKPEIALDGSATLFPMQVKPEKGWLAISTQLCDETMPPLGLSYLGFTNGYGVQLSSIVAGSPASLAGFQEGDVVDSISGQHPEVSINQVTNENFITAVGARAQKKEASERSITFSGRDRTGRPFTREVVMCPANYPHRENAQKNLDAAKDLASQ